MVNRSTFPQSADTPYAADFATHLASRHFGDFVEQGLSFTIDYGVPSVDVSQGKCFITVDQVSTPDDGTEDANEVRLKGLYTVQLDAQTVFLSDATTNYIYVNANAGTDDNAVVEKYTSPQSDDELLKIGEIDTSSDTSTTTNRLPDMDFQSVDTEELIDGAGVPHTGELMDQSEYDSHAADNSAHHTRYSDSEARTAVDGATLDIVGDADTVDGQDWADIQNWVNTSSDVPNADYADDADTVDGKHYSDIQNWVQTTATVPHDNLSSVGSADHHTRYDDAEAVSAIESGTVSQTTFSSETTSGTSNSAGRLIYTGAGGFQFYHNSGWRQVFSDTNPPAHSDVVSVNSDDHHTRYNDTEAISAIETHGTPLAADISGDSDTLDGQHWNDIQNWVENTSSVPHANLAGVTSDDHHTRYSDGEARAAMEGGAVDSIKLANTSTSNVANEAGRLLFDDASTLQYYQDGAWNQIFTEDHVPQHSEIAGVGASDHHTRYADSEARTAIENGSVSTYQLSSTTTGNVGNNEGRVIFNNSLGLQLYHEGSWHQLFSENHAPTHNEIAGVGASDHHTRYADSEARTAVEGNVDAADLNGSSGSSNQVLQSDGTNSSWTTLPHDDLTSVGSSDHHTRYADSEAVSAVESGTLARATLSSTTTGTESNTAGKFIYTGGNGLQFYHNGWRQVYSELNKPSHSEITGVGSDDHHSRYTDGEARTAVEGTSDAADLVGGLGTASQVLQSDGTNASWVTLAHDDLTSVGASDHHTRYSDSEARSAVENGSIQTYQLENTSTSNVGNNEGAVLFDDAVGLQYFHNGSWNELFTEHHHPQHSEIDGVGASDHHVRPSAGTNISDDSNTFNIVQGSGSGLNADLVDGLQASQFVRSDQSDSMSDALTLEATGPTSEGGQLNLDGADTNPNWSLDVYNDEVRFFSDDGGDGNLSYNGSSLLIAGDTAATRNWVTNSAKASNANLLDGLNSNQLLRSDTADEFTGNGIFIDNHGFGGSAGSIALAIGDPDTGLHSLNDGRLELWSNSSERVRITTGATNVLNELQMSGSKVATEAWVGSSADVPNADYADNAGQLDGIDSTQFLRSDQADSTSGTLTVGTPDGSGESSEQSSSAYTGDDYVETPWVYASAIEAANERGASSTLIELGTNANSSADEITFITNGTKQARVNSGGSFESVGLVESNAI